MYENIKEAYMYENNVKNEPVCQYCKVNNCNFFSFKRGFNDCCESKECVKNKRRKLIENTKIEKNDKLLNYIINNIDFYVKNKNIQNIKEPFTGLNIKNLTLHQFISRRTNIKDLNIECNCEICGTKFSKNILSEKTTCSKKCDSLKLNGYINNKQFDFDFEINKLFFESFLKYDNIKKSFQILKEKYSYDAIKKYKRLIRSRIRIENIKKCPHTSLYYISKPKTRYFKEFCDNYYGEDKLKLIEKYFPEKIINCDYCGKFINVNWNETEKLKKFCSNKCYFNDMKFNKQKYFNQEKNDKQSRTMKDKILKGEFTPNVTNSWANSKTTIEVNKTSYCFRSSWEAIFFVIMNNFNLKYEKIRIPYEINNSIKTYIPDFSDEDNRIIYEIKPKSQQNNDRNKIKEKYAIKWCKNNNYKFVYIDEDFIKNNIENKHIDILKDNNKIYKALKGMKIL